MSGDPIFALKTDAVLDNYNLKSKYRDLNKEQTAVNKQINLKSANSSTLLKVVEGGHFVAGILNTREFFKVE